MTIVPKSAQHQILAVAVSPQQWAEILKSSDEDDVSPRRDTEPKSVDEDTKPGQEIDDVLWMGDEEDDMANDVHPTHERERRSAYLILKCLQGERLL